MYKGRSSERGSKSQSRTSTMQEKHSPEQDEINMAINKQNLLKEIKPEEIKPRECKKNKDCDPLNKDLLSISKYKYNCNNGICVKEKNNNRIYFFYKNDVRTFKGNKKNDGSEFIKFNKFHKHKDKIYEFLKNAKYLIKYNLIKYYDDHNGLDDYLIKTLNLKEYVENNLSDINNIKIEKDIQKFLDAFQGKEVKEMEKELKEMEKEVKEIIDIINKSGIKILGININNEEFNNLLINQKLKYLKDNREIILKEINKIKITKDRDGFLIFKINSLLNPKNGGKLKKEKLKKEKLKKSDKKPNKKADKKTKKS
jgi:hypothetical protein